MKLTIGKWGGKINQEGISLWKSREKRISCINVGSAVAGTTKNSQVGMKARLLATSKSGFSILEGWRSMCQGAEIGMERCVRTVRVRVTASQGCGAELRFYGSVCTSPSVCSVRGPEHVEERVKQLVGEDGRAIRGEESLCYFLPSKR